MSDGSIFLRSDGKWAAKYKHPNTTKTKYLYGKSEKEVKKKLREYKQEVMRNPITVKKMSVQKYMNDWLINVESNRLKPKSFDRKETTLINQVYPKIGDLQIASLTANDVQNMINELLAEGLSYSTIKKAYDSVNACFKLGVIKEEIARNPCLGVKLPTKHKKKSGDIEFFTEDEAQRICEVSKSIYNNGKMVYRLGYAIVLLMYTGLRIGELLDLKWSDFNADAKTLTIDSSIVLIKNRNVNKATNYILEVQDYTKTEAGIRTVYLSQKAIAAIEELRKINGRFERIVSNAKGEIADPTNIDRMFRQIQKRCGIKKTSGVHILRHTFASMLFKKGVDVKTVSELLGHASVQITYDTYIHLIKEQKQQAITLLDDL